MKTIEKIIRICGLLFLLVVIVWSGYMAFMCLKQSGAFPAGCFAVMTLIFAALAKNEIKQIRRNAK